MTTHRPEGFMPGPDGPGAGRTLVVILHGWGGTPDGMRDIARAVRDSYPERDGIDIHLPRLPYAKLWSFFRASRIVADLMETVDELCGNPDRYQRIILVGFSMGAVLARRLFLAAAGADALVPSESPLHGQSCRAWAARIERIVTLSGLNRGWTNSGRLSWVEALIANMVAVLGHGSPASKKPIAFQMRRGAPFIVQTRLQ